MSLLVLALLVALPAQEPSPTRPLTLANRSGETLRAGDQVFVPVGKGGRTPHKPDVELFHKGKRLSTWFVDDSGSWFRLASDIPAGGRDAEYKVRPGGGVPRGGDVFDFYEDFQGDLDPKRWEWDRAITFQKDAKGLMVTSIPGGRSEFNPCSFVPRLADLKSGSVLEVRFDWIVSSEASFTFAVKGDVERKIEVTDADRARARDLIKGLGADSIEERERATRELVKMGTTALAELFEAAKSDDSEVRARTRATIESIYRENPPLAVAVGYTAVPGRDDRLDRWTQLGKLRSTLKSADGSLGGWRRFTISRDAEGGTSIRTNSKDPVSAPLPDKVARMRVDFWAPQGGAIGQVWIRSVIQRRFVEEMPVAEFGAEETGR